MRRLMLLGMTVSTLAWGALPSARAESIPDMMPADTMLYLQWPGIVCMSDSAGETEFTKMMNEPEIKHFRREWNEQIWPVLESMLVAHIDEEARAYPAIKSWLKATWTHPTGIALVHLAMGTDEPQIDVGIVVRAGKDAQTLVEAMDQLMLLATEDAPPGTITDITLKGCLFKKVVLPEMPAPLLYGARGDDVIVTLGTKLHERWASESDNAPALSQCDGFRRALEVTQASDRTPLMYLNLESAVQTLESFQPLLAGQQVPAFREAGGVRRLLEQMGLENVKSLSAAVRPHAGGFLNTMYLHAPNRDAPDKANWVRQEDLRAIPRQVTWASVNKGDIAENYRTMVGVLEALSPEAHLMVSLFTGQLEAMLEMSVEEVLDGFGETWIVYDAPGYGGLWFTGLTLLAEVEQDNRIESALRRAVAALASMAEAADMVTLREETYRDVTIVRVNVAGVPMPLAPAWTQFKGYWILALHPQMIRAAVDHLLDDRPCLADNPDFKRARELMPDKVNALSYGDVKSGVEAIYRFVLPFSQAGAAMAQGQGIPLDGAMLPSLPCITRHLFGAIEASAPNEDGYVWFSHTPVPGFTSTAGMSAGFSTMTTTAMTTSILLPSLARAREMSRHTVSASNLRSIAVACLCYSEQHDGKLPPDLETLLKGGDRAYLAAQTLKAPNDASDDPISYIYISGQNNTMDPRNVLAYEKPGINDEEGVNVAFLDGHVQFMGIQEFEEALTRTKQRLDVAGVEPVETKPSEP